MATALSSQRTPSIGTVATAIGAYTAPSVTTGVVITGLSVANTLNSGSACAVNVYLWNGTTAVYLVKNCVIQPGSSISLADEGNRIVMNTGDQVFVVSTVSASVDAVMSISQIT